MIGAQRCAVVLAILAIAAPDSPVVATENGSQMYPVGTNTVLPGIAPSAGQTFWQNYNLYYSADAFKLEGGSLVPGFQLDIAANATRLFHGWRTQAGPFGLASAFVVPVVYSRAESGFNTNEDFAIGDVTVQPLYLTYVNDGKTLFAYSGVDVTLPVGTAISRRYVAANPVVTATWFPTKAVDVNGIAMLEFALSENKSTNYRSGNLLVLEYSAHGRPFAWLPKLSVGVNGYYVKQFTSDRVEGADIGFEGRAFAIGPELVFQIGDAGGLALKWQHEFNVRNRPEGNTFWFQFQVPFGIE